MNGDEYSQVGWTKVTRARCHPVQENLERMEIDFASEWNEKDGVCEDAKSDEESCKFVCVCVCEHVI